MIQESITEQNEFLKEYETLLKKYDIPQAIAIFSMEGFTRIVTVAETPKMERDLSSALNKLHGQIGNFKLEGLTELNDLLDVLEERSNQLREETENLEKVVDKTSQYRIAYRFAKERLSNEDYEKLEETISLKNAAVREGDLERAAKIREKEMEILQPIVDSLFKVNK